MKNIACWIIQIKTYTMRKSWGKIYIFAMCEFNFKKFFHIRVCVCVGYKIYGRRIRKAIKCIHFCANWIQRFTVYVKTNSKILREEGVLCTSLVKLNLKVKKKNPIRNLNIKKSLWMCHKNYELFPIQKSKEREGERGLKTLWK